MSDPRAITAPNISEAWLSTVRAVASTTTHQAVHVTTRIAQGHENPAIRAACDQLLTSNRKPPAERVANTLFPKGAAARHPKPEDLAAHYREVLFPRIKRFPKNNSGTYFGRLVERIGDEDDQLTAITKKLRSAAGAGQTYGSRYELNIYDHHRDQNRTRGFPCLSFVSLHLKAGQLHACAHYRNHRLIERAYGNYLGVMRLQTYLASAVDVRPGELLIVAGHAEIDTPITGVRAVIDAL